MSQSVSNVHFRLKMWILWQKSGCVNFIRYKNVDILTKNGSITKLLVTLEWSGMFKISSLLKKYMDLNDFECLSYFRIGSNTFCGIQMFLQKNFKQATSYKQCFIMFIKIFGF